MSLTTSRAQCIQNIIVLAKSTDGFRMYKDNVNNTRKSSPAEADNPTAVGASRRVQGSQAVAHRELIMSEARPRLSFNNSQTSSRVCRPIIRTLRSREKITVVITRAPVGGAEQQCMLKF